MAQAVRLGIFLLSAAFAVVAFFSLSSFWVWAAPLVIFIAGSVLSGYAFNRLATIEEKQRDLEDRVRNPPS